MDLNNNAGEVTAKKTPLNGATVVSGGDIVDCLHLPGTGMTHRRDRFA